MTRLIAERKKPAQNKYKQRRDNIARIVHLDLCQKLGLFGEIKWYNHKPVSVVGNGRVKILCNFNIETDHVIEHKRPDIVVLYKKCHFFHIAVPWNKGIELEKTGKRRKLQWTKTGSKKDLELVFVPVVTGALGVKSKRLKDWLLDVNSSMELLQKAALLGTTKFLRQVLETWGRWVQLVLQEI